MRYLLIILQLVILNTSIVFAQSKRPLKVIIDTDLGNDVDDVLALDLLYKYQDAGKVEIAATINNKGNVYSAPFLRLLNKYYGYPGIPVGDVQKSPVKEGNKKAYVEHTYNLKEGEDFVFSGFRENTQYMEAVELYRKTLAESGDSEIVIISIGFSTNLSRLLDSKADRYSHLEGMELVAKKVKFLSLMGGDFRDNRRAEFNIRYDIPAAKNVLEKWPGKIYVSPWELGAAIKFSGELVYNGINYTTKKHPLKEAYAYYLPMPYDREIWDLTSVVYAVYPKRKFFSLSKAGKISVDKTGKTFFRETEKGDRFIIQSTQKQLKKMVHYMEQMIIEKPKNFKD